MLVLQFLHLKANLLFTEEGEKEQLSSPINEFSFRPMHVCCLLSTFIVVVGSRTDYHASADVAEFGLLAVVVLELVGFVVDADDGLLRFWILLFHLNFLLINEVDLGTHISWIGNRPGKNCTGCRGRDTFIYFLISPP